MVEVDNYQEEKKEDKVECLICTEAVVYFAIPETCNHNMICWTCILKQRMKSNINSCPVCKADSDFVLITDDSS